MLFNKVNLFVLLSSLLLININSRVEAGAASGSSEAKDQHEVAHCLCHEPSSAEKSDSKEDCAPFELKATSTVAPTSTSAAPSSSSSVASSSSSPAPSSSSSAVPSSSSSVAPSSNFTSHCRLKHHLVSFRIELTISQQVEWDLMIVELSNKVLSNPCGCMSDEEKVVKVGKHLKKHFKKHPSHKDKLHYKSIGTWGKLRDFIQVGVSISSSNSTEVLTLDANDSCKMFEAITNCTGSASVDLIVNLKKTLKRNDWSKTQKHAKAHKHFRSFFKVHPELEVTINDCEIDGGFGDVESFREVFHVAHRTTRLAKVISGNNDTNCELLRRMQEKVDNLTMEGNITLALNLLQLKQVIQGKFEVEIDLKIRLKYVSIQIFEILKLEPFMIQVIMDITLKDFDSEVECGCDDSEWGDVYDLAFCSHLCTNENSCDEVDGGEGTDPTGAPTDSTTPSASSSSSAAPSSSSSAAPSSSSSAAPSSSSSSAAPSSSSSSAAPTSSTAAPPTTFSADNCQNRPNSIDIAITYRYNATFTWMDYSLDEGCRNWGLGNKGLFATPRNNIKNCCAASPSAACVGKTLKEKVNYVKQQILGITQTYKSLALAITIQGSGVHGFIGSVNDFCNCADM